jgi:hypothetical protein
MSNKNIRNIFTQRFEDYHKNQVVNRYHLYSYGKRFYVFNCDYWFAYKICFELDVSNTMSADWCADILQTIQKYGGAEIFNTDQGVNTPVRFTPMYY